MQKTKKVKTYSGPSKAEIDALPPAKVHEGIRALGEEPSAPQRVFSDDLFAEEHIIPEPPLTAAQLKVKGDKQNDLCWRGQLLSMNMHAWINGLSDDELVEQIEHYSEESMSVSDQRYSKKEELRQRLSWLLWPVLIDGAVPSDIDKQRKKTTIEEKGKV